MHTKRRPDFKCASPGYQFLGLWVIMEFVQHNHVVAQYLPERADDFVAEPCAVEEGA
jgi:hypothetical protein